MIRNTLYKLAQDTRHQHAKNSVLNLKTVAAGAAGLAAGYFIGSASNSETTTKRIEKKIQDFRHPSGQANRLLHAISTHNLNDQNKNLQTQLKVCMAATKHEGLNYCFHFNNRKIIPATNQLMIAKKGQSGKIGQQTFHYSLEQQRTIAIEFVNQHLDTQTINQHIKQIKRHHLKPNSKILITYPSPMLYHNPETHQKEFSSRNQLPVTYAYFLSENLKAAIDQDTQLRSLNLQIETGRTPQCSRLNFTEMANHPHDFFLRLISKPVFGNIVLDQTPDETELNDKDNASKFAMAFLVEDDTESGSTMLAFIEKTQQELGASIPCQPSVFVKAPGTKNLFILPNTKQALLTLIETHLTDTEQKNIDIDAAEHTLNSLLAPYDKTIDQLTNITALCMIALLLDANDKKHQSLMNHLFLEYQHLTGDPIGWMTIDAHEEITGKKHALKKAWLDNHYVESGKNPIDYLRELLSALPSPQNQHMAAQGTPVKIIDDIAIACRKLSIDPVRACYKDNHD